MLARIGDTAKEATAFVEGNVSKPVVSHIASVTAPAEMRGSHLGAIISGGRGIADEKFAALVDTYAKTVRSLDDTSDG